MVNSGEEAGLETDVDSVNRSDGTQEGDDSDFSACPIYASDCGGFPDSSNDMNLDTDTEDLNSADVKLSADNNDGPAAIDVEQWKFTFSFSLNKNSGMDDAQQLKILRHSM